MRVDKLRELLEDYNGDTEVKIEVRGETETPDGQLLDTDGIILDIVDDKSVYFYMDGTVHIIGDTPEEE